MPTAPHPAVVVLGFRPVTWRPNMAVWCSAPMGCRRSSNIRTPHAEQRAIPLCNSGVMAIDGKHLFKLIDKIGNNNAKGEYYLTDIVKLAVGARA